MKELLRLLRYARPYVPALLASVVFMAIVGLSQGLLVKLIPLVFERVLKPETPDAPALPWDGGVAAAQLVDAVRPLVAGLRVEDLSDDDALWGGPVTDERYALVATV